MKRLCVLSLLFGLSLAGCASHTLTEAGRGSELDSWVQDELQPYLARTLTSHPRFKGETVLVTPMREGRQDLGADELTRSLAHRLNDWLLQLEGVHLGWQGAGGLGEAGSGGECPGGARVHYLLGLEIDAAGTGRYRLQVKALDLEDGNWVSGFGREWEGLLLPGEREQLSRHTVDERLRGERELPFTAQQADLMARQLAEKLWCAMQRRGQEDLRIWVDGETLPDTADGSGHDPALTRLVANYLARGRTLNLSPDRANAEAILRVRRQHVHGELHQLWASLRAVPGAGPAPALDSEVYFAAAWAEPLPGRTATPGPAQGVLAADHAAPSLIQDVRLMVPRSTGACASPDPWRSGVRLLPVERSLGPGQCYGLEMKLMPSARMVLLRQRHGSGVCRLGSATVPSSGRVRWPSGDAMNARQGESPVVYYLLAWTDADAGRALARLLGHLGQACGKSDPITAGSLEEWLSELDSLMDRYPDRIHWQGISIDARS